MSRLALCARLRDRGTRVCALVRPGSDRAALDALGVEVIPGDTMEAADVARAFAAHGAGGLVVSTLSGGTGTSGRVDDLANILVIDQAVQHRPEAFVFVTSLGCGDTRRYMSERSLAAFGDTLVAKTIAEDHLRRTALPWTILRPGGLRSAPATHRGALFPSAELHGMIHREDVALLVLEVAGNADYHGAALIALDPALMRGERPEGVVPVFPRG